MFGPRDKRIISYVIISMILLTGFMSRVENAEAAVLLVSVQTDHPTYNPGETVPVRVHVTTSAGTPVNDAQVFVGISPPSGGVFGGNAHLFGGPGWYTYQFTLSSSASGGVYGVRAQATRAGDTSGSAETTFTVTGPPGKKIVDWAVYSPSVTPPNPTTGDLVRINVWLRIAATVSPGPYPVDIICTVDGATVGGGTITMSGSSAAITVYTDPRKYPAGTHTAIWIVDPNSQYNDNQLSNNVVSFQFTVSAPAPAFDFSISASPTQQTITPGASTTCTITVSLMSGTSQNVILSVSGAVPSGISASLNPTSGTPSFNSVLSISAASSVAPGQYVITITGTAGAITHPATVTLTVAQSPDFRIDASPPSQTSTQGQTTSYSVNVVGLNGFNSQVSLTIAGLPGGVGGTFTIPSSLPDYSSTLTLTIPGNSPTGSFTLTITGSGGGLTRAANVVLMINPSQTQSQTTTQTGPPATGGLSETLQQNSLIIIAVLALLVILFTALAMRTRGRRTVPQQKVPSRIYCGKCGKENPASNDFCASCGNKLTK